MRKINLHLFDEGAAAGGDGASNNAVVSAVDDAQQNRSKTNPLADVQYGIQSNGQDDADGTEGEAKATFKDLIAGEYKDDFEKAVQGIVQKRLKGANSKLENAQNQLDGYARLAEAMKSRYGDISPDEMADAFMNDDSMLESEAMEQGIDVDTLRELKQLRYKAKQYEAIQQANQQEEIMRQQFQKIEAEAEDLKKIYPNFSLENELQNDELVRLVSNNIPLRTAFEVLHRDEIQPAVMQYVAKRLKIK